MPLNFGKWHSNGENNCEALILVKTFITFFSIIVLVSSASAQTAMDAVDSSGCPPPKQGIDGPLIPPFSEVAMWLSGDGKNLAFEVGSLDGGGTLNLTTQDTNWIIVHGGLPGEQLAAVSELTRCPYDPDLLALTAAMFVDTTNSGSSNVYVVNLFIYRISTGESHLITPKTLGQYGPEHMTLRRWLSSSHYGNDTLIIGFSGFTGEYVPETESLIKTGYLPYYKTVLGTSIDESHSIYLVDSLTSQDGTFIDSTKIEFPRLISEAGNASFSPDNKLFALEIAPITGYSEVWIYDVSNPSKPIDTINFQNLYCTYSLWGVYPVFITDSTLAVSMHHDGDESSPLWEITIDGRIVRQLTFLPEYPSGVANEPALQSSFHLTSHPNPFSQSSTITFSCAEPGVGEVTIVNLLGAEVARLFSGELGAGEHSFQWDASGAAAGVYECVVRAGGQVQRVKIVCGPK